MSEYQYYEFRALDRALTEAEHDRMSALSSRAKVTPRSARYEYAYGDFRGDPRALVEASFDAMLYAASWGTRRLILRWPASEVPLRRLKPYADGETVTAWSRGRFTCLDVAFTDEGGGGWVDGPGMIDPVLGVRREVARGDDRPLYLAWLLTTADRPDDEDEDRAGDGPPVPPGMCSLTSPQWSFVELFGIPDEVVEEAAARSTSRRASAPRARAPRAARAGGEVRAEALAALGFTRAAVRSLVARGALLPGARAGSFRWSDDAARRLAALFGASRRR